MKPPKNVRKAMKSFLGVKKRDTSKRVERDVPANYKSNLQKSSKFGSVGHLNTLPDRFKPARTTPEVGLGRRSASMPPAGRNKVEDWDANFEEAQFFMQMQDDDMASTHSNSLRRTPASSQPRPTRRSQSFAHPNPKLRSSQSLTSFRDDFEKFAEKKETYRDSGAFDMYVNEDISQSGFLDDPRYQSQSRASVGEFANQSLKSNSSRQATRKLPRSASFSDFTSDVKNLRTTSHTSHASERLMSCMSALDHLEKKLQKVSIVNNKIDRFKKMTEDQDDIPLPPQQQRNIPRSVSDWQLGGEEIDQSKPAFQSRGRRRSAESSDSGITAAQECWGANNHENPPSRPRKTRARQLNDKPNAFNTPPIWKDTLELQQKRHLRSDSTSSGYSSGSGGGMQAPALPPHHYPQAHPGYFNDQESMMSLHSLSSAQQQYQGYDYGQQQGAYQAIFEQENPYGYGKYPYAPSSVYEDDMLQHNGWFYLPGANPGMHYAGSDYGMEHQHHTAHNPYIGDFGMQSYPYYHTDATSQAQSIHDWSGVSRYGALSDQFADPAMGQSALAHSISNSCADTSSVISSASSKQQDIKKYGSFRYRNGQKTVLVPESRKRKTVRFSKTVNQRVEHCDSEVEDSTSVIKGCSGEETYDIPTARTPEDPNLPQSGVSISEPIYEFPAGHIENSCMCSDCKLARSSCKLQTPSQYAYY